MENTFNANEQVIGQDNTDLNINKIIEEVDKDPNRLIRVLESSVMEAKTQLNFLEESKKNLRNEINSTENEELIAIMDKIDNPNIPLEDVASEISKLKESCMAEIRELLLKDKSLLEILRK